MDADRFKGISQNSGTLLSRYSQVRFWWAGRRLNYNIGLAKAGISAFVLYVIVASIFISDEDFEITLFTTLFQGFGYLLMMGVANICYMLGPAVDYLFNKSNSEKFRGRLYRFGYRFSVALPFFIPLLVFLSAVFFYTIKSR